MSSVVGCRYRIREKIGEGSFGVVNRGDDIRTGKLVAIKIESKNLRFSQLETEANVYKILSGGVNIPHFHCFAPDFSEGPALVIDYEGPSIEDLLQKCSPCLSLKTVLMLADQMLASVEFVHKMGLIHRDIKPDNFVIGNYGKENQIYLIDFGLSKPFRLPDGNHIRFTDHKPLTGTARYASISTLSGNEQSRRDDMESLAYIWIYLLKGGLPWVNLKAPSQKIKYDKILAVKLMTPADELCSGLPYEFMEYLNLVKQLQFSQEPEYSRYRKMFRDLFIRLGYVYDYKYDWCKEDDKPVVPLKSKIHNCANEQKIPKVSMEPSYPAKNNAENREINKSPIIKEKPAERQIKRQNLYTTTNVNANANRKGVNPKPKKAVNPAPPLRKKASNLLDGIPQFHSIQISVKCPKRPRSAVRSKK